MSSIAVGRRRRGCWELARTPSASCCNRSSTSLARSSPPRRPRSSSSTTRPTSSCSRRSPGAGRGRSSARGSRRAPGSRGLRSSRASRSSSMTWAPTRASRETAPRRPATSRRASSPRRSCTTSGRSACSRCSIARRTGPSARRARALSRFSTQASIGLDLLLRARRRQRFAHGRRRQRGPRRARRGAPRRDRRRRWEAAPRGARATPSLGSGPGARQLPRPGTPWCPAPGAPTNPLQPTSIVASSTRPTSRSPRRPADVDLAVVEPFDLQAVTLEIGVLDLLRYALGVLHVDHFALVRHRAVSFRRMPGMASHPT